MHSPISEVSISRIRRRRYAAVGAILICISLILAGFLISTMSRAREAANRVKCGKQIRAIGQAIFLYANEHRGVWPPDLKRLFLDQDISPGLLLCPSVEETHYTRADLEADAPALRPTSPAAYIYVGNKITPTTNDAVVILYELMSHHGDGFHIVFADGHAEFLTGPTAEKVQTELQSGQNPPPSH